MNPDPGVAYWLYWAVLFGIAGFALNIEVCQALMYLCLVGYAVDKVAG